MTVLRSWKVLVALSIKSFALIDELTISFNPGFSVLTGETGAGKSILVDALSTALGERVSSEVIRSGTPMATIDAVFSIEDCPAALKAAQEAGINVDADNLLILSRQIAAGRSQCRINGRPVTLGLLQDISRHLVDIHGQHEHQALIHPENHLEFLDNYGGPSHLAMRHEYEQYYNAFISAQRQLAALRQQARERAQRLDMLRFQIQEIKEARIEPQEEEELLAERQRLLSIEQLRERTEEALAALSGTEEMPGAVILLAQAAAQLRHLAEMDSSLGATAEELDTAATIAAEAEHIMHEYQNDLDVNPQRLEEIEQRLALLSRLKRKYGDTVADVLCYLQRAEEELAKIENFEAQEEALLKEQTQAAAQALRAGKKLSEARRQLAQKLSQDVVHILQTLGMPAAQFEVAFAPPAEAMSLSDASELAPLGPRGMEEVQFMFCANEGEELRPLAKIASGGELSRIMLAFKSLCSRRGEIPTIIFDEIDAGIGGHVAHRVAEKLADLAQQAQVLCVTHLPQIAGLADHHLQVSKKVREGRTIIHVKELSPEERIEELIRMFGADSQDEAARLHAQQLLQQASARRAS